MSKVKQTLAADKPRKAKKPRKDFPLFPHATGRWAKKVRGKHFYFGKIADDPDGVAALNKWLADKDALLAGRTPRVSTDGVTIADLANQFLTAKKVLLESCELTDRTFGDWWGVCDLICKVCGRDRLVDDLAGDDFDKLMRAMAKTWGPTRRANTVQRIRSVFKYGVDAGLLERLPRYGANFKKPAKAVLRKLRAKKGQRMFEADELQSILESAPMPLKAMILLGANCGFGNSDVASLELSSVDLVRGYINFPRPKTGVDRRCPLWPETVEALKLTKATRPAVKDPAAKDLFFVTRCGSRWGSVTRIAKKDGKVADDDEPGATIVVITDDPVAKEFTKLIKDLKLHRPGLGFYGLRHGFETIAGGSRDQAAVDAIMGHCRNDMASVYRERLDDDRLLAVVNHVHSWLFPSAKTKLATKKKWVTKPVATPRRRQLRLVSA
jgi:integrase